MGGQQKGSSALDLWGDLDGFQTIGGSSNHKLGGNEHVCVCVCVRLGMALINFQLQRWPKDCVCVAAWKGGGVWGLNTKATEPFKTHKVLVQSKPLPAMQLMSLCVCVCVYLCVHICMWRRDKERQSACTCMFLCMWENEFVHSCAPISVSVCVNVTHVCVRVLCVCWGLESQWDAWLKERKMGRKKACTTNGALWK